ncbi:MAG: hypothetical protein ACHQ4J_12350 [Candidatus Binatia bacterium]
MGTIVEFRSRRRDKESATSGRGMIACAHCGEQHPIVRLGDGNQRCVTAFADGPRWFCRNRGCRAAWLARQPSATD